MAWQHCIALHIAEDDRLVSLLLILLRAMCTKIPTSIVVEMDTLLPMDRLRLSISGCSV